MCDVPAAGPGRRSATLPRLKKRSEFQAASRGRRFHTERMSVQCVDRPSGDAPTPAVGPRFGLTVTKKTGGAVERNRIRRRLREALRRLRPEWPPADIDIVVVARRDVLSAPFDALAVDLRRAMATFATSRKRLGQGSARKPATATDPS
jgi:ribonuclease P protein component